VTLTRPIKRALLCWHARWAVTLRAPSLLIAVPPPSNDNDWVLPARYMELVGLHSQAAAQEYAV